MNLLNLSPDELLRYVDTTDSATGSPLVAALAARLADELTVANPDDNALAQARQEGFDEEREGERDWQYVLRLVRDVVVDVQNTYSGVPPSALTRLDSILEHAEVCGSVDEWQEGAELIMGQAMSAIEPMEDRAAEEAPKPRRLQPQRLLLDKLPAGESMSRREAIRLLRDAGVKANVVSNTLNRLTANGTLVESTNGTLLTRAT